MAPLIKGTLQMLQTAVDLIPEQDIPFRQQTTYHQSKRVRERKVFRKLAAKLAGADKEDQVAFLIDQARKVDRKTYVVAALKSITTPPDYISIQKDKRPTYAHVHRLIDIILPIVAGSSSSASQKKIFENRWAFVHKEQYIPSMVDSETLQKLINEHDSTESLWKVLAKVIERLPNNSDEKENELKQSTDDLDKKFKLVAKLIKKIFNKKTDQLTSVIKHARKISRSTYIQKALETIPIPPEYSSLNYKDRKKYSNVHNLINIILPIAAGSSSPGSQLKLLENRCKTVLKKSTS